MTNPSITRPTIRCPHCKLMQFARDCCVKCHKALHPEPLPMQLISEPVMIPMRDMERLYLAEALERYGTMGAAEVLDLDVKTIISRKRRFGIPQRGDDSWRQFRRQTHTKSVMSDKEND